MRYLVGLLLGMLCLAAALIFAGNVWVLRSTEPYIYGEIGRLPANDVGLLLGTSPYTRKGNESALFRHRIEAAVELYQAGKIRHVLASGANPDDSYNEPRKMYRALVAQGVPPEAISMDFAGFRTLDSVVRAGQVFGQGSFTVISQRFHVHRAVFIARHAGLQAVAYAAPEEREKQKRRVRVRETLARVMAILDVYLLRTEPRFLGEPIRLPIAPPPAPAAPAVEGATQAGQPTAAGAVAPVTDSKTP